MNSKFKYSLAALMVLSSMAVAGDSYEIFYDNGYFYYKKGDNAPVKVPNNANFNPTDDNKNIITINITGTTLELQTVEGGGYEKNKITLNEGRVDHIYGGRHIGSSDQSVSQNKVYIDSKNGTGVSYGIYGGYTDAPSLAVEENEVYISAGYHTADIYGGYSSHNGGANAINNLVKITGGQLLGDVYGGYANRNGADVEGNSVEFNGGINYNASVYGGYSENGSAKNNSVILNNNGTITNGNIYGGYSANKGDATNNTVIISRPTSSNVYGGYSDDGDAINNTVTIECDNVGYIYGGDAYWLQDSRTGNTLNLGSNDYRVKEVIVKNIFNFENLNFYLPTKLDNDYFAMKFTDKDTTDLTETKMITINGSADGYRAYLDGTDNKYYLLKSDGKIIVNDTWLKGTQSVTGNTFNVTSKTEYNVAKGGIFQSSDKKDLYITGTANSVETIIGDTFGDDEAGIKDGITINLADNSYSNLKINLSQSRQATINFNKATNVGNVVALNSDININSSSFTGELVNGKSLNLLGTGTITATGSFYATNDITVNAPLSIIGGLNSAQGNINFSAAGAYIGGTVATNKAINFGDSKNAMRLDSIIVGDIIAQELNFYLPSDVSKENVALSLQNTGTKNLTGVKVNAYLSDATGIKSVDDKIHLIQTKGSLTGFDEADGNANLTNVNIAGLINVTGKIALDSTAQYLDLSFNGDPAIKWSSKDTTFNITEPNKFTRTMTNGTNTQDGIFTIIGNFDFEELKTITNATDSAGTGGTFTNSYIGNTVNVDLKSNSFNNIIYGGFSNSENVSGNTVKLNTGTVKHITGGASGTGVVSGNTVIINGGTVTDKIYGGLIAAGGDATDGTVTLLGGDTSTAEIYGSYTGTYGVNRNNTLNIGDSTTAIAMNSLKAKNIYRFDNLNFYLPSSASNEQVALNLATTDTTDLTNTTIKVNGTDDGYKAYLDDTGNKYYLLKSNGEISVDDTWLTSTQSFGNVFNVFGSTQYSVAKGGIFQSSDKKDLYITDTANSVETITGDTFGDDEAGIKDGIKVNFENSNYAKLNINIANSATINLTNAHNVGSVISSGSTLDIKDGSTFDKGASVDVKTANFGDSSNAMVMDIYEISALKAKELNFYLPSNVAKDETALKVANSVDLSGTKVNAYLKDATGITNKDDKIHLIQTAGSITGFAEANGNANLTNVNIAGLINITGKIALDSTAKNLDISFDGDPDTGGSGTGGSGTGGNSNIGKITVQQDGAKTLLETKLSQSTAVNEGANLLVSNLGSVANAANNANSSSANNVNSLNNDTQTGKAVTFAFVSGYDKEDTTGSHIDIKGFNANAGIAGNDYFNSGNLTTGLFVEYGKGEYDSFLDDGTTGSGKTEFIGGGAFARFTTLNNFYTEISGRVGKAKTSYETTAAYKEFDVSNTYYGAHLGLGKIFNLTNSNELDIFARGIWAKTAGNDIVLNGIQTHFDSVTSLRTQVGFKDNIKLSDTSKLYVGASYQYEFDGESKGTLSLPTFGSAGIASPKLKGSTGIGEIGYVYENSSIKFEAGAKGYVGKEKGYSGNLGVTFKF